MSTPLHRVCTAQQEVDAEVQKNEEAIKRLELEVDDSHATIVLLLLENYMYRQKTLHAKIQIAMILEPHWRRRVIQLVLEKSAANPKFKVTVEGDSFVVVV